jgi:uncharacterized protein YidB (DUF937 family)
MSCPEGSLSTGAFRRRAGLVALRLLVGAISDRTQLLQAASSATADPENLHRIADETGTTVDEAAEELSKAMPELVDKLSPDGELPSDDAVRSELTRS